MTTENKLPECPYYVAHPQAVWFNEHWRPVIEQLKFENEQLKSLMSVQIDMLEQNKNMTTEISALKSKLKIAKMALEFYADRNNWADYPSSPHSESDLMYCMGYKYDETARQALSEIGGEI